MIACMPPGVFPIGVAELPGVGLDQHLPGAMQRFGVQVARVWTSRAVCACRDGATSRSQLYQSRGAVRGDTTAVPVAAAPPARAVLGQRVSVSASTTTPITGYRPSPGGPVRRITGWPLGGTWIAPQVAPSLGADDPAVWAAAMIPVKVAPRPGRRAPRPTSRCAPAHPGRRPVGPRAGESPSVSPRRR